MLISLLHQLLIEVFAIRLLLLSFWGTLLDIVGYAMFWLNLLLFQINFTVFLLLICIHIGYWI